MKILGNTPFVEDLIDQKKYINFGIKQHDNR